MKKAALIMIASVIIFYFVPFLILGKISRSGDAAGLLNGKLQKCPDTPNCVSSEQAEDTGHYIPPISMSDHSPDQALNILKNIILELGGEIQREDGTYLSAAFSSSLFGFTDDLELRLDPKNNVIQIRSSSRVGYGDLGANRKRVELIRKLFVERLTPPQPSPNPT
jgi:uncharacterized protein (DUF1499 family)